MNLSQMAKSVNRSLRKRSPEILIAVGILGMIGSTVMAVKATPKAIEVIENNTKLDENGNKQEPTNIEKVKLCWKLYLPTAISAGVSIACIVGSNSVNAKRNAALATAYTLSETALRDYTEKVVETIGEKKEQEIKDAVAKDRFEKNIEKSRDVIIAGPGKMKCYDIFFDRYFESDVNSIKRAVAELNRRMNYENYISANDYFDELGIKECPMGSLLGWNLDRGLIDVRFTSVLDENEVPCLAISHNVEPKPEYY